MDRGWKMEGANLGRAEVPSQSKACIINFFFGVKLVFWGFDSRTRPWLSLSVTRIHAYIAAMNWLLVCWLGRSTLSQMNVPSLPLVRGVNLESAILGGSKCFGFILITQPLATQCCSMLLCIELHNLFKTMSLLFFMEGIDIAWK